MRRRRRFSRVYAIARRPTLLDDLDALCRLRPRDTGHYARNRGRTFDALKDCGLDKFERAFDVFLSQWASPRCAEISAKNKSVGLGHLHGEEQAEYPQADALNAR